MLLCIFRLGKNAQNVHLCKISGFATHNFSKLGKMASYAIHHCGIHKYTVKPARAPPS
jgi:hypothetical protein